MSSPFDNKGVFHSAIVKNSPLEITLTCDGPIKSQFAGKPPYISFKCEGEDHTYPIENDDCGRALSGMKGETITITATGRDKDAEIIVETSERRGRSRDPEPRRQERQPDRQERQAAPPPEDRDAAQLKAFKKAKVFGAQCSVLMQIAFKLAHEILKEEIGLNDGAPCWGPEDERALATTLFIEMKSQTDITKLPTHWIDTKAAKQPERQPEPQRREPEPPPDEDEPDIPF